MKKSTSFFALFCFVLTLFSCGSECVTELTIVEFNPVLSKTEFYLGQLFDATVTATAKVSNGEIIKLVLPEFSVVSAYSDLDTEREGINNIRLMYTPSAKYYNSYYGGNSASIIADRQFTVIKPDVQKVNLNLAKGSIYEQGKSLSDNLASGSLLYAVDVLVNSTGESFRLSINSQYLEVFGIDESDGEGVGMLTARYLDVTSNSVSISIVKR